MIEDLGRKVDSRQLKVEKAKRRRTPAGHLLSGRAPVARSPGPDPAAAIQERAPFFSPGIYSPDPAPYHFFATV